MHLSVSKVFRGTLSQFIIIKYQIELLFYELVGQSCS